jgi:predicted alpha-1,6-mannanase (GH76 family)
MLNTTKTTLPTLLAIFLTISVQAQQNILDYSLLEHPAIESVTASAGANTLQYLTDKDVNTVFEIENFSGNPSIQINARLPFIAKGYSFVSSDDALSDPKSFSIDGLADDNTWKRIGTSAMGKKFPGRRQALVVALNTNNTPYRSFRLVFTQINGGTNLKISEFQLFGYPAVWEDDLTKGELVTLTGEFPGSNSDVLSNIRNDNPEQIFKQNNQKSAWIQYELPQPEKIEGYALVSTAYNNTADQLKSWKLLASNDALHWDVLDVRNNKNVFEISNNRQIYAIAAESKKYDWAALADFSQQSLIDLFWKKYGSGNYLVHSTHANSDSINTGFNYWWMAHALDVFVDGYARTQDETYKNKMKLIRNGMLSSGGNSLKNGYFDDMEWMGLACLRASEVYASYPNWKTDAISLWNWIKAGWNDNHGGGIQWVDTQPASKNACSNAPAIILAARLYEKTGESDYLDWAKKIFDWMNGNLIFETTGLVKDGFGNEQHSWTLTYNQGTWIGACLELYKITNEQKYYDIAMRTADYVLDDREKFSPYGILYNNEGGDDGGLFKGIFMRYLSQWILSGKLDQVREDKFVGYFIENGKSLWESATSYPESGQPAVMFGNTWYERSRDIQPNEPKSNGYDASIHLSAVMLFELLDELNRNGFLPETCLHPSAVANKTNAYKYYRLQIEANQGGSNIALARWQLFRSLPLSTENPQGKIPDVKIKIAGNQLILSNSEKTQSDYFLFNLQGQALANGSFVGTQIFFLPNGIYIAKLNENTPDRMTHKFIIR